MNKILGHDERGEKEYVSQDRNVWTAQHLRRALHFTVSELPGGTLATSVATAVSHNSNLGVVIASSKASAAEKKKVEMRENIV